MFCKIFTTGNDNYVYLNPNCNMKLIYEYLRVIADIPENYEIDLCTEGGHLLGIFDAECSASGLTKLIPRANYYIFIFDYREDKPDLYDPRPLMDYTDQDFSNVFGRIKMNFGIPRDEYIKEDDAELIFEHMLIAYEEKTTDVSSPNTVVDVATGSRGSLVIPVPTRKGSRKSVKSEGTSRVLQVWREEKRLKLAATMSAAEESEEVFYSYTSRRKSRASMVSFPGLDVRNSNGTDVNGIEEEVEDYEVKQVKLKATKKTKKTDKKKKHGKDADHVSLKQDDLHQKTEPPVGATSDQSGASVILNCDSLMPLSSLKDSSTRTTIRQFFKSHSSTTTVVLPKPPPEEKQDDNKSQADRQVKRKRQAVSKKRSNKSKYRYSASTLDRATVLCSFVAHVTAAPDSLKI